MSDNKYAEAEKQALAQLESIKDMISRLEKDGEYDEDVQREIYEDALSIEVRSGWTTLDRNLEPEEFRILLCTGGPAVQLVGDLDENQQPINVKLQAQDWFISWKDVNISSEDEEILLKYASQFYFGV